MRSIDDPVRLRDFKRRHPVETSPSVQSAMTTARSQVRDLNKQRTAIQKSNLSADAKDERLKRIKERYDQIFVRFNTAYNRESERQR
jgi:RNase adaptor protein for sRNA GlmZ degradation